MLEGSLCCRIKHFCDYSWYEVFLQNDWHISYLSILLQNETANSAIMKDTFFVLILSEWKYYLSLSLAKVWRIDASHWLPTVLYPGSSVTLGTCLLQIILASVQVTGVTGVVRRQGGVRLVSLDSVSLRSLSRQLWGGESRQYQLVSIVTSPQHGTPWSRGESSGG